MCNRNVPNRSALSRSSQCSSLEGSDISAGQFIVTHADNLQTDRTFYWLAIG
jgi:hypothetical protein